jgi:hypothetical protein
MIMLPVHVPVRVPALPSLQRYDRYGLECPGKFANCSVPQLKILHPSQ